MDIAALTSMEAAQATSSTVAAAAPEPDLPAPLLNPAAEIAIATLFLVVVIAIHGIGLGRISKFFSSRFVHLTPESPHWHAAVLTSVSIALIVSLHFAETHIWAATLLALDMIGSYRDAYFYVLEAYTTLGEGPNYLPDGYRLISPVIALTGLFTFGWSGSVLVYIVGQTGRLHAERSQVASRSTEPGEAQEQGENGL